MTGKEIPITLVRKITKVETSFKWVADVLLRHVSTRAAASTSLHVGMRESRDEREGSDGKQLGVEK